MRSILAMSLALLAGLCISAVSDPWASTTVVSRCVASLGPQTTPAELRTLEGEPRLAVRLLVDQLKSVDEIVVRNWEFDQHTNAMKVVWALRGLRYLTGTNVRARTDYAFGTNEIELVRSQMLGWNPSDCGVDFFGVWMSRDSIYFAPQDAQEAIILRWKRWIRDELDSFKPRVSPATATTNWYF